MVDVRFQKEVSCEYMILDRMLEDGQSDYEEKILHNNQMSGFLDFNLRQEDGVTCYYYKISHMKSLSDVSRYGGIEYEDVGNLIKCIKMQRLQLGEYLLNEDALCLDEQLIFRSMKSEVYFLTYIPGYRKCFEDQMRDLLSWLMKHINYTDKNCVSYVFGLYRRLENGEDIFDENAEICEVSRKKDSEPKKSLVPENEKIYGFEQKESTADDQTVIEKTDAQASKAEDRIKKRHILVIGICAGLTLVFAILGGNLSYWWREITGFYIYPFIWPLLAVLCSVLINAVLIVLHRVKKENRSEFWEEEGKMNFQEMKANETVILKNKEEYLQTQLLGQSGITLAGQSSKCRDTIKVTVFPFTIGKNESLVQYAIREDTVSRRHVQFSIYQGKYYVTDLYSTNGTKLNGSNLSPGKAYEINHGDRLHIAGILFEVQMQGYMDHD